MRRKKYKQKTYPHLLFSQPLAFSRHCGVFSSLFLLFLLPLAAHAWTFDPNNLITDNELKDKNSLSKTAIQLFLEREKSALSILRAPAEGSEKTASEIIWEVGQKHNVSPKFLLANLEKEKGLIQKTAAAEKDFDWAMGYSCFSGKCNDKYKGFYNQVESAAITQNIYFEKSPTFQYKPGAEGKTRDGYTVTPKNQATANLYIYTPFIGYAPDYGYTNIEKNYGKFGANYLFWQIWTRYFSEKKIPNGFAVKNGGEYWLIENGKKRKFSSQEIYLRDHRDSDAIFVSAKTLDAYENGSEIYFGNKSIVRSNTTNQAYVLFNGQKRPVVDNSALALLGDVRIAINSIDEIPVVDNEKISGYALGNPIDANSKYPLGKIFEDENGGLFSVQDGMKYPLAQSVLLANFPNAIPEKMNSASLNAFVTGAPVKLRDGAMAKNSQGAVYLISDGEKIKVKQPDIFQKVFGEPSVIKLQTVPDEILALHEDALNISYADDTILDPVLPVSPPSSENFSAELISITPESIAVFLNQKKNIDIVIKNTGTAAWTSQNVWLESDNSQIPISFQESKVESQWTGTFSYEVAAPQKIGLNQLHFSLSAAKTGAKEKILEFGKFIMVQGGDTAEILSHNIPIAVKNSWKPISITMKIKNTSQNTIWLSRKTALEIYEENSKPSPFYDANDWVRKEVAAVPVGKSSLKPGEAGEFRFTLKVRGIHPGTYRMKFKLNMLDKKKYAHLNGEEFWTREIRVDK